MSSNKMINLFDHRVEILSPNPVFKMGKFTLFKAKIAFTRFNGERALFSWLIFDRGDSVAVLLRRQSDAKICLVEQFRPPTLAHYGQLRASGGGVLEIIAGTQEPGEEPESCVCREVAEETGRLVKNLHLVTTTYMSPGASSEKVSLYLGEDDGDAGVPGGGLAEEMEDIMIHWVSVDEIKEMIQKGRIVDAKTIMAFQALLLELSTSR